MRLKRFDDITGKDHSLFKFFCVYGVLHVTMLETTIALYVVTNTIVTRKNKVYLKSSCTTKTCKCRQAMILRRSKYRPNHIYKNTIIPFILLLTRFQSTFEKKYLHGPNTHMVRTVNNHTTIYTRVSVT